jgi:hypothetical protein
MEWFKCKKYEDYTYAKMPFGETRLTAPLNLTLDDKCRYSDPSPVSTQNMSVRLKYWETI